MEGLKIQSQLKRIVGDFTQRLKDIYQENLVSLILYGSAASGEFIENHSNLNLLVVLKDVAPEELKKASCLINKYRFKTISPLFLTEKYIQSSLDIFPIEFLDMQENYLVVQGLDVLKGINVDTRNLRFQCEQELKSKLINLRQLYIRINKDKPALRNLLFKSITSVLHILRNVLRLKGKKPAYNKEDIVKELAAEFSIDASVWAKILSAKNKRIKIGNRDTEDLFVAFVKDLEKIVEIVNKL